MNWTLLNWHEMNQRILKSVWSLKLFKMEWNQSRSIKSPKCQRNLSNTAQWMNFESFWLHSIVNCHAGHQLHVMPSERPNLELFNFIEPNSNSNFYHRTRTELEPNFSVIKWYIFSQRNGFHQFNGKKLKPKYKIPILKKAIFGKQNSKSRGSIFEKKNSFAVY